MHESRYSAEQVLRGITAFFLEYGGVKVTLDPDASVYSYLDAATEADGECPLYFLCALAEYFGLDWSERRFIVWLELPSINRGLSLSCPSSQRDKLAQAQAKWEEEIAPRKTVRSFAEWIASKAPGISMAPRTLFGCACAPAGVFLGLASLPEVGKRRIAPSTPLLQTMRAENVWQFWVRVGWVSGARLPELRFTNGLLDFRSRAMLLANGAFWAVGVLATGVLLYVAIVMLSRELHWGAALGGLGMGLAVSAIAAFKVRFCVLKQLDHILPLGVRTFGDLARLVAEPALQSKIQQ